jgi:sec-independent protein translocase protein TatA
VNPESARRRFGRQQSSSRESILALVLVLLFGTKKLPELGRSLGRGLREFKEGVTGKPKSLRS